MAGVKMTKAELRFLEVVAKNDGTRASHLGAEAYGGGKKPQAYARPATNVLRRLEDKGMVFRESWNWGTLWLITPAGSDAVADKPWPWPT